MWPGMCLSLFPCSASFSCSCFSSLSVCLIMKPGSGWGYLLQSLVGVVCCSFL
uniref:Uncharacterized protein n=1 Tax=Rhizophora mucronata TaxID=61149 RepID=A0A2P2QIQ2_RHIMU